MGMSIKESKPYPILNSTEYIDIAGIKNVPAKIDTGADSSAVWASDIKMEPNGKLSFVLFDTKSPFYTGEYIVSDDYTAKFVRSSHGDQQVRYQVKLEVSLHNQSFTTAFTLANRSQNNFPVLIGRHTLKNRFLVDVSKSPIKRQKNPHTTKLKQELKQDPYKFHQRYIERSES